MTWQETASRVADEMALDLGQTRMAKVSSMLHAFRDDQEHCDIEEMVEALRSQGVAVHSPGPALSRREVLDLSLAPGDKGRKGDAPAHQRIRLSQWRTGETGHHEPFALTDSDSSPADGAIRWFDLTSTGADPTDDEVEGFLGLVGPWCPGLNDVIVRDLLTPDVQPKAEIYGDELTGVRTISVPAVVAREIRDDDDHFDDLDEHLIIQIVEIAVGPGWMISCWQPSRTLRGGGRTEPGAPLLREPFLDHVAHRWLYDDVGPAGSPRAKESGDLAVYLARSLVSTFGASLRMVQRWVSSWEVTFFKTLGGDEPGGRRDSVSLKDAAREISNFLAFVGEFARSVNAFGLAADEMPNDTWFADTVSRSKDETGEPGVSDHVKAVDAAVEAAVHKLSRLYDEIRADMDLLMVQSQARQQEASERLQGYLGKVTGLILVPTFVAGLFGANTALPGQETWFGFELMVLLMIASAGASYWVIRRVMR